MLVFQEGDANRVIVTATENMMPNLRIVNTMSPSDVINYLNTTTIHSVCVLDSLRSMAEANKLEAIESKFITATLLT